jgi:hypothetical protein
MLAGHRERQDNVDRSACADARIVSFNESLAL